MYGVSFVKIFSIIIYSSNLNVKKKTFNIFFHVKKEYLLQKRKAFLKAG